MSTIERLYKEWRALQPLQPELQRRMDQQFMFDFNYNSNRKNYLDVLGRCDNIIGFMPFDGANASKEQIEPLLEYIANLVEKKLSLVISYAKGEIMQFSESGVVEKKVDSQIDVSKDIITVVEDVVENTVENITKKRKKIIVQFIKMNKNISANEIAKLLKVNLRTVQRDMQLLKNDGVIERIGGDRGGYWKIVK
ncbi:MAG: HTH domain-containing protein [Prevotellaceae bacterium]|jgi:transcription initiation factor IIE alpha subunit|nr:HTH domain-containing protein [Prevotellaceae bacterium]